MDAYRREAEAILDDLDRQRYDLTEAIPFCEPTAILRLLREESHRQEALVLS